MESDGSMRIYSLNQKRVATLLGIGTLMEVMSVVKAHHVHDQALLMIVNDGIVTVIPNDLVTVLIRESNQVVCHLHLLHLQIIITTFNATVIITHTKSVT